MTSISRVPDASLIATIAEGDRGALAELYDRYSGLLLAIARRVVRQGREAEDLLHDVFLEVWRHAGDFDVRRGSVRTWLCMRMRSRALDRCRLARLSKAVSLPDSVLEQQQSTLEDPSSRADHSRVREALATLPTEQREVLLLGYFEGLSSSEIAERVGVPIGTVKSRVAAGRNKLRSILMPHSGGPDDP
ncbi:MAG: RNA polymerase sigma-70 factor (ECF subfamily) [Myxococcota bacterium]